jgi:hypothetical protein
VLEPVPTHPVWDTGAANAVSCVSPRFCMAVEGTSDQSTGAGSLQWNGTKWTLESFAASHSGTWMTAVSCASRSFCVAVGSWQDQTPAYGPLLERWNGSRWSLQHAPGEGDTGMEDVACPSSTACIAVASRGVVDRWDGRSWRSVLVPRVSPDAVWCASATSCVVVDYVDRVWAVAVWNGTSWTVKRAHPPPGANMTMLSWSCMSPNNCWAVGWSGSEDHPKAAVVHWDGTRWSAQPVPQPWGATLVELAAISCGKLIGCTAVGNIDTAPLIERLS